MIPFISITSFPLGPFTIHLWGLFVAMGILAAAAVTARFARARGLQPQVIWDMLGWIVLAGIVGARLFHVVFYEPSFFLAHPLDVFKIWNGGLAVTGGLIAATVAGIFFLRHRYLDILSYANVIAFGLPLGDAIGRIGCFLTHMHPGVRSSAFFAVAYPDGARLDLGLLLSLNGLVLFLVALFFSRRVRSFSSFAALYLVWQGTARFFLDFLRASDIEMADARYLGFTPAQYGAIVMVLLGLWLVYKKRLHPSRGLLTSNV